MQPKTYKQILSEVSQAFLGPAQQYQQIASGQGTTASGQGVSNGSTIDPYANIFGNAGSPLDPQVLKKLLQGYTVGLTPQEAEELEVLRKEYELAIKAAKIAAFKKKCA